ncbi:hypothetical protein V5O48_011227 [Marasmius crinis-equi]|uniref:F-box domain-containing protein n=1 Tax=Marasmius crinis-equi TaxID=585013 RepID=A0ABR3F6C3_9AGAR
MIDKVPPETATTIFSHLPISDIHSLQLASKSLNDFVKSNEGAVYQSAAIVHGFVASDNVELEQLEELYPSEVLVGMERTWKALCQRMFQLDKNWRGDGRAYLTCFPKAGCKPAGIKVDEKRGFIINITDLEGDDSGLIVVDKNDNVLWSQPWPFLKCGRMEYENGYLIFSENDDQEPGYKEIWRLASIPDPAPPKNSSQALGSPYPTLQQKTLSDVCYNANKGTYPHGHFVPHASLPQYTSDAVFQFRYPTLMSMTSETSVAFYDVPTRELVHTVTLSSTIELHGIDESLSIPDLGRIWSAEFNSTHIFLCAVRKGFRTYDRETGKCVLDVPADRWIYASRLIRMVDPAEQAEEEDHSIGPEPRNLNQIRKAKLESIIGASRKVLDVNKIIWKDPGERPHDEAPERLLIPVVTYEDSATSEPSVPHLALDSVRVSKCGNHLVCLSRHVERPRPGAGSVYLVIVRDLQKILPSDTGVLAKQAVQIDLGADRAVFGFDGERRVFVVTSEPKRDAAFIVDLGDFLSSSGNVKIGRAVSFDCDDAFELEITNYGVYVGWDAAHINGWKKWTKPGKKPDFDWGTHICGLDFAVWD